MYTYTYIYVHTYTEKLWRLLTSDCCCVMYSLL